MLAEILQHWGWLLNTNPELMVKRWQPEHSYSNTVMGSNVSNARHQFCYLIPSWRQKPSLAGIQGKIKKPTFECPKGRDEHLSKLSSGYGQWKSRFSCLHIAGLHVLLHDHSGVNIHITCVIAARTVQMFVSLYGGLSSTRNIYV